MTKKYVVEGKMLMIVTDRRMVTGIGDDHRSIFRGMRVTTPSGDGTVRSLANPEEIAGTEVVTVQIDGERCFRNFRFDDVTRFVAKPAATQPTQDQQLVGV